jgi:hypothetical protein
MHLVKKRSRLKKGVTSWPSMVATFCGGHCVMYVTINPPTYKTAFLWARKKE